MARRGMGREKVLATVVHLLEATMIRVGNADYVKQNKSHGLTTLRDRHVKVEGTEVRFRFKGKSGKTWDLGLRDRRVARIVRQSQELPGQHLFQYLDDEGERRSVTSGDVNALADTVAARLVAARREMVAAETEAAAAELGLGAAALQLLQASGSGRQVDLGLAARRSVVGHARHPNVEA